MLCHRFPFRCKMEKIYQSANFVSFDDIKLLWNLHVAEISWHNRGTSHHVHQLFWWIGILPQCSNRPLGVSATVRSILMRADHLLLAWCWDEIVLNKKTNAMELQGFNMIPCHAHCTLHNLPEADALNVGDCVALYVVLIADATATPPSMDFLCTFASGSFELELVVEEDDGVGDGVVDDSMSTSELWRRLYAICCVSDAVTANFDFNTSPRCWCWWLCTILSSFDRGSLPSSLFSALRFLSRFDFSCLQQLSHLSGPGSNVIRFSHASHASQTDFKKSENSESLNCADMGILTVKFLFAAVTIFTSPFKSNSRLANCVVSKQLSKISCTISLANALWLGAVSIDRKRDGSMNEPTRHFECKWTVIGVVAGSASSSDINVFDGLILLRLFVFGSILFRWPGGCMGWQLFVHQPTGKISRESYLVQ